MRIALRVLLAVVAAMAPATADAQRLTEERQVAGWIFTPAVRFGGAWDNNILLADPDSNPPSDYATPVSPSATLDYRGRRTRLSSGYDGSFLMYQTFGELNSSEHRVRGVLEHRATPRLMVFTEGDWARVPTTDALVLSGIPFFRIGSRMASAGGGFESTLARHLVMRGRYTLRRVDFEEDDEFVNANLLGGHAHEVGVSLNRAVSARLTVGTEYELRRAIITDLDDRVNSHTASGTVQYALTPATTVSGLLGVSRLDAGLLHEPRTGPAVRAGIIHRARLLVLSASYQRSFIPSFGFGGTFQNEEWQGNVHVPFARNRAYVDGSVARFNNDPLVENQQPSLRSVWLSGTLGYRFTRWLSMEGFYSQSDQSSQRAGGDLGRRQVGFRMHATKPMKLD
jgi:hypothetical protein